MDETSTESSTPATDQTVIEPVASSPVEPTVAPASVGEPEVAGVPVIQIDTPPAPQIIEREIIKEVPVDRIVEKEVIKEVFVEKPIDRIVERVVYKDAEITPASFRAYLKDFLHRVGPKGRAMQHERAQKKRADTLKLFDTHQEVTHKLVMDTLHFSDREASRVLSDLRAAGKILIHEPARHDAKTHHGGRGTFYTRQTPA